MIRLAKYLETFFPHHSLALKSEIIGVKMTDSRWNRVATILASLHAVPGVGLSEPEHDARNAALASIAIAQKMAASLFGGRDPQSCRELALSMAQDIDDRIKRNEQPTGNSA
jgi:hypothetical protein